MERRIMVALLKACGAALLAFGFLVCSNPIDIVGSVATEVKVANNKFLIISGVGPDKNSTEVNPGSPITINFDRDIDLTNIESNISVTYDKDPITPYTLDFQYSKTNKILSLDPNPYFGDETTYTVRITKGVRGADGSDLQNEYAWSFKTGTYPAGSVQITNTSKTKLAYTNDDATPTLWVRTNDQVQWYRLGRTEPECLAAGWISLSSTDLLVSDASTLSPPFSLGTAEGTQSVYYQFRRTSDNAVSLVKSDSVILDKTPPVVEAGPQKYVNSTGSATPGASASDPAGAGGAPASGIASYSWSFASPVVASPANVLIPALTVPVVTNADYTLTLTVADVAGNTASDTMTLTNDNTPPNAAPVISGPATPTSSAVPLWSWTKGSTSGGEATPLFSAWLNGSLIRSASTSTSYRPKPLIDGSYALTVKESDYAGNLSVPAASTVVISGLPNEATITSYTPTFTWPTLYDRYGSPAKVYIIHLGTSFVMGEMKLIWEDKMAAVETKEQVQSYVIPSDILSKFYSQKIYWYVDFPDQRVRCPADPTKAWSFAVPKL